jgi:hypothetical protein
MVQARGASKQEEQVFAGLGRRYIPSGPARPPRSAVQSRECFYAAPQGRVCLELIRPRLQRARPPSVSGMNRHLCVRNGPSCSGGEGDYAFPVIRARRVDQIDTPDILRVLSPPWLTKPETARRVKQRLKTVFDWARAAVSSADGRVGGVRERCAGQSDPNPRGSSVNRTRIPCWAKVPGGREPENKTFPTCHDSVEPLVRAFRHGDRPRSPRSRSTLPIIPAPCPNCCFRPRSSSRKPPGTGLGGGGKLRRVFMAPLQSGVAVAESLVHAWPRNARSAGQAQVHVYSSRLTDGPLSTASGRLEGPAKSCPPTGLPLLLPCARLPRER